MFNTAFRHAWPKVQQFRAGFSKSIRTSVPASNKDLTFSSGKTQNNSNIGDFSTEVSQVDEIADSQAQKKLHILLFYDKFNGLSQRIALELKRRGHILVKWSVETEHEMTTVAEKVSPDLIICPFLAKRIPEPLLNRQYGPPCLVVHPGIRGDRGMHSLDWALKKKETHWGVTVLQAAEEMDAGDIWDSQEFPIERTSEDSLTKSSLYTGEVTKSAVRAVLQSVDRFIEGVKPVPLDYRDPMVTGRLQTKMKSADRMVDWNQSAEDIACIVRMSDGNPGALVSFRKRGNEADSFRAFGAFVQKNDPIGEAPVGEVIGHRDEAICVQCGDGAVWLSHLKKNKFKLPATSWLPQPSEKELTAPLLEITHGSTPKTFQEIWFTHQSGVTYLHFDFYNGAMSTRQCMGLTETLRDIKQDGRCKVLVLLGGYNTFSNGIHLNVIEAAENSADESWENINAINDVVQEVFSDEQQITIAALQV